MGIRPYTIAEVASAHQGDLSTLKYLASSVLSSNFSAIKFQIYDCEELLTLEALKKTKLKRNQISPENWRIFFEWFHEALADSKNNLKTEIIIEPFGLKSLEVASTISGVSAYKLPTSDTLNPLLLHEILSSNISKIYIGTGGATLSELDGLIDKLNKSKLDKEVYLVHGFQSYPTEITDSDLWKIRFFSNRYGLACGYADHASAEHTASRNICSAMAVAAGAHFIEKHIIHERNPIFSDYYSAILPSEYPEFFSSLCIGSALQKDFKQLVSQDVDPTPFLSDNEEKYRRNMKKYMVASTDILPGQKITSQNIAFKRVDGGQLSFNDFGVYVNQTTVKTIHQDEPVLPHHILA